MESKLQVTSECVAGGFKQIPLFTFEIGRTKRNDLSYPLQGRKSPPKPAGGLHPPEGEAGGHHSRVTPRLAVSSGPWLGGPLGLSAARLSPLPRGPLVRLLGFLRARRLAFKKEHSKKNVLGVLAKVKCNVGLPCWLGGEESAWHERFDLWFEKIPLG